MRWTIADSEKSSTSGIMKHSAVIENKPESILNKFL